MSFEGTHRDTVKNILFLRMTVRVLDKACCSCRPVIPEVLPRESVAFDKGLDRKSMMMMMMMPEDSASTVSSKQVLQQGREDQQTLDYLPLDQHSTDCYIPGCLRISHPVIEDSFCARQIFVLAFSPCGNDSHSVAVEIHQSFKENIPAIGRGSFETSSVVRHTFRKRLCISTAYDNTHT